MKLAHTAPREKLHAPTARTLLDQTRYENHHLLSERKLGQIRPQMEKSDWDTVHFSTVIPGRMLQKVSISKNRNLPFPKFE